MYGGGTGHRRVRNSQNKGGNIATKEMSKCGHVFGILIGSCVISCLNSDVDGWSLRPLLYSKKALSTRPLLLPKSSA